MLILFNRTPNIFSFYPTSIVTSFYIKPLAKLEKGRLLVLKKCENIWCNVKTDDYSGWVKTENIWGSIK